LEIATGQVYVQTTEQKKREDFRRFLDSVVAELPANREIHVILDNSIGKPLVRPVRLEEV
jgi:hypothetical protein